MATPKRNLAIFSFVSMISSCAPLEQAPLVYSSKSVIGIDLSATATEQPGISVNIGYKQVDAAYVPVAVAKSCDGFSESNNPPKGQESTDDGRSKADCTNEIYKLLTIAGNNTVEDTRHESGAEMEARSFLEKFKALGASRNSALKELADAKFNKEQFDAALTAFKSSNPAYANDTQYKEMKAQHELAGKKFDSAEEKLKNINSEFANFDVTKLLNSLDIAGLDNNKQDAYSVFGSFDAKTKAATEADSNTQNVKAEVGLALGKVFSTGVASQNLTEGMRKYYEHDGLSKVENAKSSNNCLTQAVLILEGFKSTFNLTTTENNKRYYEMHSDLLAICKKNDPPSTQNH